MRACVCVFVRASMNASMGRPGQNWDKTPFMYHHKTTFDTSVSEHAQANVLDSGTRSSTEDETFKCFHGEAWK